jgi:hypothetical protein
VPGCCRDFALSRRVLTRDSLTVHLGDSGRSKYSGVLDTHINRKNGLAILPPSGVIKNQPPWRASPKQYTPAALLKSFQKPFCTCFTVSMRSPSTFAWLAGIRFLWRRGRGDTTGVVSHEVGDPVAEEGSNGREVGVDIWEWHVVIAKPALRGFSGILYARQRSRRMGVTSPAQPQSGCRNS